MRDETRACIYSFDPLDVGFDPRQHDTPVVLWTDATGVRFRDQADALRTVTGSIEALKAALEGAGFKVILDTRKDSL